MTSRPRDEIRDQDNVVASLLGFRAQYANEWGGKGEWGHEVADLDAAIDLIQRLRSEVARLREDAPCTCEDFAPGVKAINGPVVLQQLRAGRSFRADHFKAWRFCPWCGGTVTVVASNAPAVIATPPGAA